MNIIHITLSSIKDTILKVNKEEKGIAIILALGLLSLLAVLALTFTTTATINKKVAKNNNDLSNARILIKSVINRAVMAKSASKYDEETGTDILKSIGDDTLSDEANAESLYELFPTEVNGINYYSSEKYKTDNPEWQYIEVDTGVDTPKIIGRIAFAQAKYADKGWIVPAAVIDNNQSLDTAVSEYQDDKPPKYTSTIDSLGNKIEGRPGVNVNEIWLGAFLQGYNSESKLLTDNGILQNTEDNNEIVKMSSNKSAGGKMSNTGWGNSDFFFNALNITESDDKNTLLEYFVFSSENKDPEAYWIDENNDNIKDYNELNKELYSRFNLTRSDWNDFTIDSILSATPVKFPNVTNAIPWLENWEDTGDFADSESCQKQIIANLIDYNDTNDTPTTDYYTTNGKPTYFGNENYPALNEVVLQITMAVQRLWDDDIAISVYNPKSQIEILRLPNQQTGHFQTRLNMKFAFTGAGAPASYNPLTTNIAVQVTRGNGTNDFDVTFNNPTTTGPEFLTPSNSSVSNPWVGYYYPIPTENITTMIIQEASIELLLNGKVIDFAYLSNDDERIALEIKDDKGDPLNPTSSHPVNYALFVHFEAKDPFQNFTPNSWKATPLPKLDSSMGEWHLKTLPLSTVTNSLGSNNPAYADRIINLGDGTDTDIETANLVELSTAFFRNAPMKSPWELGAINRGKVWQTINLKKYNATEGADILTGGGNAYADGDANILDQIKMTSDNEILGKINLNTSQYDILRALFQGIATNSKYVNPGAINPDYTYNDIVLSANDAFSLETTIIDYSTQPNSSFKNRAEVVNVITNAVNGSLVTQPNDASQEEIIGKFINLTQASPIMQSNELPIIAIVQTIDDIGDVKISLDLDNDGVIGDADAILPGGADENTLGVDLNGDGDKTDNFIDEKDIDTELGEYDQFADKITATQKVLVKLYQANTGGKYRIKHLEYIND